MARAALGLGGCWVHEHRLAAVAAEVEVRQRRALRCIEPASVLALRLRARLAAESDYRAGSHDAVLEVVDEARRLDDPIALAEALSSAPTTACSGRLMVPSDSRWPMSCYSQGRGPGGEVTR
jgi:hypothetical protein